MAPPAMRKAARRTASFFMLFFPGIEKSAKQIYRARPDQVPIFLGDADVERVVAGIPKADSPPQLHPCRRIFVGKPVQPHPATDAAARVEHDVLAPDVCNAHFRFHRSGGYRERAGIRIAEDDVGTAEAAGRKGSPLELIRSRALDFLVEVPHVDRRHALERVAAKLRPSVPDRLSPASSVFRAFPDEPDAPAEFLRLERA